MDGVLVIDKPAGLTSHDVVAAVRRALGETRIGHTGTLDPLATGVLPLACGRATRLARFFSASVKEYEAEIRFGLATDTYDITGAETMRCERRPSAAEIDGALASLTGEYLQTPPPYSAKKIGGRRAYSLARSDAAVQPAPAKVRVEGIELVQVGGDAAAIRVRCSAGFYVRSLAHDLGIRLGTGACLSALRRTSSGGFTLADAVRLQELAADPGGAARRVVPLRSLLPDFPTVRLTEEGALWVSSGRTVGSRQLSDPVPGAAGWVRLLSPDGELLALATATDASASLHPSIVLH